MTTKKRRYCKVVCTDSTVGETKNGHPQLILSLRVVDGEKSPERMGEEITMFQTVVLDSDDSARYAVQAMRALGMTNSNIFAPEGVGTVQASLCEEWETYEGSSRWRAKYINPIKVPVTLTGTAADSLSAALAAAFASQPPTEVTNGNKAPDTLPTHIPSSSTTDEEEEQFDLF